MTQATGIGSWPGTSVRDALAQVREVLDGHLPYLPELPAYWQTLHPGLTFSAVLSEADGSDGGAWRSGHVHEAVLADHPDLAPHDLYMSGPPPMIDAARHRFVEHGLDPSRLYYDSFEYAPDVIAAILAARAGLQP